VTALITGIGYIGAALAEALLADGQAVVGLENGFSTVPSAVRRLARHPRFRLVRGSINSTRSIERAFEAGGRIGVVYHLAAQASAHPDAAPASYTETTNLVAPRLVFEAAARHGAGAFVYGSSFRVYGDDLTGAVDERTPYGPIGDLAHLSKVYAEKLLEMLAARHALPVANVRLGVVYGLGPLMKRDPRFLTVPNLFCLRAAAGETLTVNPGANRPIGFLHLDDAVQALRMAGEVARARGSGATAMNAVAEVLGVGEVAAIVEREAAARALRVSVAGAGSLAGSRWTVTSSLDAAGFRPTRAMSQSLGDVLDYYARRQEAACRRQ
jgi:UDP-glucuronate 4-epimerase